MTRDELLSELEKEHGGFVDLVKDLIQEDIEWLDFYASGRVVRNEDDPKLEDSLHRVLLLSRSALVVITVELEAFHEVSTEFRSEVRRKDKRVRHEATPLTQISGVILDSSSGEYGGRRSEPPEDFRLRIERIGSAPISLPSPDENEPANSSVRRARSDRVVRFGLNLSRVLAA